MKGSDLEQPLLQGRLLESLGRFVGAGPEATKRTFKAAIPSSMYALAEHGSSEVGARSLLDGLRSGKAPQLEIGELGDTLADPQASDRLMTTSGAFLERIAGGRLGGILDGLTSHGGVGRSAATKLMALAAPLALGVIGKRAREENLDARGLSGFLRDQKPKVATLVPKSLRRFVGLGDEEEVVSVKQTDVRVREQPIPRREEAVSTAPRVVEARRPAQLGWRAKWPWLLAALAAFIGLGWLVGHAARRPRTPDLARAPEVAAPRTPDVTTPAAPTTPPANEAIPSEEAGRPAAGLAGPALQSDSDAVKQIGAFLDKGTGQRRFAIDGLAFDNGASTLSADGRKVTNDLAAQLAAHPDAKIRVEGFTDATGDRDANQALSLQRADEIKRAIMQKGIAADRIETTGQGAGSPIAPNDSSGGRAANRRIEVVVTAH